MENTRDNISETPPSDIKYVGFYRGRVIEHGEYGTCRIWIPEVYPVDWVSEPKFLPLAEQAQPFTAFGAQTSQNLEGSSVIGSPGGVYSYPAVGSYVWCFFINGNIEQPVYFAACVSHHPDSEEQWENIDLSKTSKGFAFKYHLPAEEDGDGKPEEVVLEVFTKNNSRAVYLRVNADNKDEEKIVKNEIKIDSAGINVFTTGAFTLTAQQGIDFHGVNINLNADTQIGLRTPGTINIVAPTIALDCQSFGDRTGHFSTKYWDRFKGKLNATELRYPN